MQRRAFEIYAELYGSDDPRTSLLRTKLDNMTWKIQFWTTVSKFVPRIVILGAARMVESTAAWVIRCLHFLA